MECVWCTGNGNVYDVSNNRPRVCPMCDGRGETDDRVDDEVVKQIMETSDDDAVAGKWPPLVQSATSNKP